MEEGIKNEEVTEKVTKEAAEERVEAAEEVAAEEAKPEDGQVVEEEKPLDKMTVKDLREIAKVIPGVTGVTAMKKDELLSLIKEDRGIVDDEPADKKKEAKAGLTVKDLKEKAARLREAKRSAQEEKDKVKVQILRRRINRLKKLTRKVVQA